MVNSVKWRHFEFWVDWGCDSPSWVSLETPDCWLLSLSFSDDPFFSVKCRTFGDALPLLGDSDPSSLWTIIRKLLKRSASKQNAGWWPAYSLKVPAVLLLLLVLGFWGMVGRAARAGFAPCGTGGFGVPGLTGELEEDVALTRVAGSGFGSLRVEDLSGAAGLVLLLELLGDLLSVLENWGLTGGAKKKTIFHHIHIQVYD